MCPIGLPRKEIMSNLPAVSVGPLFPSAEELKNLKDLAATFISSGLLPRAIDKPEKAILIMLKGKEAGIAPLQALAHIHVIDGKPSMSAELMLSQLYKNIQGFVHQFAQSDNKACRVKVRRPGTDWMDFSFTIEDANAAGLTGKGPWKAYTAAMLRARCLSAMARAVGPDALAGISYTPEELGVEVDATGAVVGGGSVETGDKVAKLRALAKPATKAVEAEVVDDPLPAKAAEIIQQAAAHAVAPPADNPWGDGLPSVISALPDEDPLANYELAGTHPLKGKRLKDVAFADLQRLFDGAKAHATASGKPTTGKALQDVMRVEEYLRTQQGELGIL
jgi:hypothetical protein